MSNAQLASRLWLIELIAWWEGRVTAGHLRHFFGLGRQQASRDMGVYHEHCPDNLVYDPRAKGYRPSEDCRLRYISGDVTEYLNWIAGMSTQAVGEASRYLVSHTAIHHPPRRVSEKVMRPMVRALRECQRLDVDYISVSNPNSEGRVIVPIRLVNTGLRWHLRAYCEKSAGYRDLVLSRFQGVPELLGAPLAPLPPDDAWETNVELILRPDPRLSIPQQKALEHDYGMIGGELRMNTRAALATYLLMEMQVNVKMLDGDPAAQQLILVNHAELRRWLF